MLMAIVGSESVLSSLLLVGIFVKRISDSEPLSEMMPSTMCSN